jgi:large subunit ribosomal protein L35
MPDLTNLSLYNRYLFLGHALICTCTSISRDNISGSEFCDTIHELTQKQSSTYKQTSITMMLTLRSLQASIRSSRQIGFLGTRGNATNTPLLNETAKETQGRSRRFKIPTRRPLISATTPRKWNRPIAEGVIPAYDLALGLIQKDSLGLKNEANALRSNIDALEAEVQSMFEKGNGGGTSELDLIEAKENELEAMRRKLHILEIQSEVNLPNVRWKVANALADMSKASHRHLLEQRWRKEGSLDLLMERVHQMHVVPDILPELHPSIDLHVTVTALPQDTRVSSKIDKKVEPGAFLLPQQTLNPPKLYANVFHTDTRLYTMLLVDLDVPDAENSRYTTYLHWMKPNIPLSAAHCGRIPDLNIHTPYIPPHPQRGTSYHRYVFLVLPQPTTSGASDYTLNAAARAPQSQVASKHLDIPVMSDVDRKGFDVRTFMQSWGLVGSKGGGAHLFRQIWDTDVTSIYADVLKEEEPRYGRLPKPDPYAEFKQTRRYI